MGDDGQRPSVYRLVAFDNAQQTTEQIDPLAYEKQPALQRCASRVAHGPALSDAPHPGVKIIHVHVTVFFDGTSNSLLRDAQSPTNVVRLFDLHKVGYSPPIETAQGLAQTAFGALYVRGVGSFDDHAWSKDLDDRLRQAEANAARRVRRLKTTTPDAAASPASEDALPDKAEVPTWWERRKAGARETVDRRVAGEQDARGNACGFGMSDRIAKAYDWVKGQAAKATPAALATVTVNAVGFSRGAATARAFWNAYREWLAKEAVLKRLADPARFAFLGLFDTVASIGVHAGSGDTASHNIVLDPSLGTQVTHLVASDEFRYNFRYNPSGVGDEAWLTGAHADIGGGYAPSGAEAQERSNALADVSLVRMYDAARSAGVPLNPLGAAVRKSAAHLEDPIEAYKGYRGLIWIMAGDLGADRVHPFTLEADARAWWLDRVGRLLVPEAPEAALESEDWLGFERAFGFWRRYIHLPYYLRWQSGTGRRAAGADMTGMVGMAADQQAWEQKQRIGAVPEARKPVRGYPVFDWEAR